MSTQLEARELARIKKLARARRISDIRKKVAVFGVSLVALFSGAILIRTGLNQPSITGTSQAAVVAQTFGSASAAGGGGDGEASGFADEESQGTAPVTVVPAQSATPVPVPAPAPLVTSQS